MSMQVETSIILWLKMLSDLSFQKNKMFQIYTFKCTDIHLMYKLDGD